MWLIIDAEGIDLWQQPEQQQQKAKLPEDWQDQVQDGDVQELDRGGLLPLRQQVPVRARGPGADGKAGAQQFEVQIEAMHYVPGEAVLSLRQALPFQARRQDYRRD